MRKIVTAIPRFLLQHGSYVEFQHQYLFCPQCIECAVFCRPHRSPAAEVAERVPSSTLSHFKPSLVIR